MTNIEPLFPGKTMSFKDRMGVALVFGSTREDRLCESVAMWAAEQIWSQGLFSLDIIEPDEISRPMHGKCSAGTDVAALRRRLATADGFVIVTAEHNDGSPAALKFLTESAGPEWQAKPVAFVTYGGSSGELRAVDQLRLICAELHAITILDTVNFTHVHRQFDARGQVLKPHRYARAMATMLGRLHWWAVALHAARKMQTNAATLQAVALESAVQARAGTTPARARMRHGPARTSSDAGTGPRVPRAPGGSRQARHSRATNQ